MKHVILGNGPAGVVAAETLRKAAPGDAITLVGKISSGTTRLSGSGLGRGEPFSRASE